MDKIRINGKANLYGEIGVSGSKNAALTNIGIFTY